MLNEQVRRLALRSRKLAAGMRSPDARSAARDGVWLAVEHEHVLRDVRPVTVLDVGANRGQFALLSRRYGAKVVHAFEPVPHVAEGLARRFAADPAVRVHAVAVGSDTGGTATLYVTEDDDNSSLMAPMPSGLGNTTVASVQEVAVMRLDDALAGEVLDGPVLLKIDVQGLESAVLRGAEGVLDMVDVLLIELSMTASYDGQALADEVLGLARDFGFRLDAMHNPRFGPDGTILQFDAVMRRR